MRLATRTCLAAALAAAICAVVLGVLFGRRVDDVLADNVDRQLVERAESAPILAAVGERLAVSELGGTIEGARIRYPTGVVEVGSLPDDELPPIGSPGLSTASADGQAWRLLTVDVVDVPAIGDRTTVQLVAPLGDVNAAIAAQRRSTIGVALIAIFASAAVGYALGAIASRPLARLLRDAGRIGTAPLDRFRLPKRNGAVEVDEIAAVLNDGLDRVAQEAGGRQHALDAARAFTAAASHELRTPLTVATTHLDVAALERASSGRAADAESIAMEQSRLELQRVASTLTALRELSDVDLADRERFVEMDVADLVAVLVDQTIDRHLGADITVDIVGEGTILGWPDGVRLAVANMLRNALDHGRRDGRPPSVRVGVHVDEGTASIEVDDDGPGIRESDRSRVLDRFERGATSTGAGIGLALVAQVAALHDGRVALMDSPQGGARVRLELGVRSTDGISGSPSRSP